MCVISQYFSFSFNRILNGFGNNKIYDYWKYDTHCTSIHAGLGMNTTGFMGSKTNHRNKVKFFWECIKYYSHSKYKIVH